MKNYKIKAKPIIAKAANSPLRGIINLPGDKSISHRAIILGSLANGISHIEGLLEGEDILATINAMRLLGAKIKKIDNIYQVEGVGKKGLKKSDKPLDFGNSGTGVRLIMGLAGAYNFTTSFIGDKSLSSRPMDRVLEPLKEIGIKIIAQNNGKLPVTLQGPEQLKAINYLVPVPSAQVKSALLLAGLKSKYKTIIRESVKTRDHSEKMLKGFGADINISDGNNGSVKIEMEASPVLRGQKLTIPGDPSSAAFAIVAALIVPGSEILIKNILLNPTRTGLITTLKEMGANIEILNRHIIAEEEVADLKVKYSKLKGVKVPSSRAPSMIDEYPILAVAASYAKGRTIMSGIGEMRIKETDRIALIASGLKANGVNSIEGEDYLIIEGAEKITGGAKIKTELDHRIAMTFLIMGQGAENPIEIDDGSVIATSYPSFIDDFRKIGAKFEY